MDDIALNELLNQVKSGQEQAFQELYRRYYKKVYYTALKISANQADAKDIAQETFIQIHKSIASLKDNALFVQWLNRIIVSKASDLFRKNKTVSLPDDHALFQLQEEESVTFIPSANMHFESDHDLLACFINALDERYRTVIVMRYFSQLSVAEIADALDVPDGTVKTRLKRGREILKNSIVHYQREEGTALDFRSADMAALLSAFFMGEYAALKLSIPSFPLFHLFRHVKHLSHQGVVAISFCVVSALSVGSIYAYRFIQQEDRYALESKNQFQSVEYNGVTYDNPEAAYYALTLFAHCEVEMEEKLPQEIEAIRPLYAELKRYQGIYWELMKFREWNDKFEKFLKN